MAFKQRLTNLQNVAPGNIATLKVPTGANAPTMEKIMFELSGGMTPAHIERIEGYANGRRFLVEGAGTVLNARRSYMGLFNSATFLNLDFTEPKARNGAVEQQLATVPLALLQDLRFDIKIAAGAPAPGRIDAQMHFRAPTNNPYIRKMLDTSQSFAASGEQIMYLPIGGAGGRLKRVWIHEQTAGTITDVELRVGNITAIETNRAKLEHSQKENGLTPQDGVVVVDFVEDGNLSGVLNTATAAQVELRLTSSAANTYRVYYEYIDPIGNL